MSHFGIAIVQSPPKSIVNGNTIRAPVPRSSSNIADACWPIATVPDHVIEKLQLLLCPDAVTNAVGLTAGTPSEGIGMLFGIPAVKPRPLQLAVGRTPPRSTVVMAAPAHTAPLAWTGNWQCRRGTEASANKAGKH